MAQAADRHAREHGIYVFRGKVAEELGLDARGGRAVDDDPALGQFLAERLGEADRTGLGGAVGGVVCGPFHARDGGDDHDPPIAALDHMGQRRAAAQEYAGQIDPDQPVPFLQRVFPGVFDDPGDPGVADHHVDDRAHIQGRFHGRRDRAGMAHIDRDGVDLAVRGERLTCLGEPLLVHVPQAHHGP